MWKSYRQIDMMLLLKMFQMSANEFTEPNHKDLAFKKTTAYVQCTAIIEKPSYTHS